MTLYYYSPKRFAHYVSDAGEQDSFCRARDMHRSKCLSLGLGYKKFDGVRLDNDDHGYENGLSYNGWADGSGINGPQMKNDWDEKREWDEHSDDNHCKAWTLKTDPLFAVKYKNVAWHGAPIEATIWVKWKENDGSISTPGPFGGIQVDVGHDDHSEKVYFDTGNAITRCLQQPPTSRTELTPRPRSFWFLICDDEGGCENPDHFKIRTYYSVTCQRRVANP